MADELTATPRTPTLELVHTCLHVADLDRSLAFYAAFGWHEIARLPLESGTGHMVFLGDGDARPRLELCVEPGVPVEVREGGFRHLGIAVDDLDRWIRELAERGITVQSEPFAPVPPAPGRPATRIVFLKDPDGYELELLENYPF